MMGIFLRLDGSSGPMWVRSSLLHGIYCIYWFNLIYQIEPNLQNCNYMQKKSICRKNSKYAADEIFVGPFALAEWLPISGTLCEKTTKTNLTDLLIWQFLQKKNILQQKVTKLGNLFLGWLTSLAFNSNMSNKLQVKSWNSGYRDMSSNHFGNSAALYKWA